MLRLVRNKKIQSKTISSIYRERANKQFYDVFILTITNGCCVVNSY